jgi:ligand-binding sensor domain-containing protein
MRLKGLILSTMLLEGHSVISNSQQGRYLNFKDGLSSSQTSGIEEDHKGLLWFETNEGVDRFDWNGFRN